ncbi:MAG: RagB/SusD family nutrient uptake outer membrane protein [Flavobacteriaceae bacterium]|nr:RagB/SusD family nutrient uptake outer membrane protein [Flavobacteriaceae bacterium]
MNKYIKNTILSIVIAISAISCDSFLDESPDNRLELDSMDKISKVLVNAYSEASFTFTDSYTDLVGPTGNYTNQSEMEAETSGGNVIDVTAYQKYTWSVVDYLYQDSPSFYWDNAYQAISHANVALEALKELPSKNKDLQHAAAIKGEALLSRAYHHFMLVNIFGQHYNESTSSTDLGVPYISSSETGFIVEYTRNSVQEVYDFVEADILAGLELINNKYFLGKDPFHFSEEAGLALASRFYLWKGDYENCKKYSDMLLESGASTFVKDYINITGSGFEAVADAYCNPEDKSNIMTVEKVSNETRRTSGFQLNTNDLRSLYGNNGYFDNEDLRAAGGIWGGATTARSIPRLRELFYTEELTSTSGIPYHLAVVLKGEEVLLNRAEANLGLGNKAAALADMDILASKVYRSASANEYSSSSLASGNDSTILDAILEERKREFLYHGLRWFDVKRHNIVIKHRLPNSIEDGAEFVLEAKDTRRAVQIPAAAINTNMEPNP